MISDIVSNFIADVILLFSVAALAFLCADVLWRRKVRAFFGVKSFSDKPVRIVLSRIYVKERGTVGVGHLVPVATGFHGYAITEAEYHFSFRLAESIETRGVSRVLRIIGTALAPDVVASPVLCRIATCPPYLLRIGSELRAKTPEAEILTLLRARSTLILAGGPAYNSMTDYVLSNAGVYSKFSYVRPMMEDGRLGMGIVVQGYHPNGESETFMRRPAVLSADTGESFFREYSIIQKFGLGKPWNAIVFVCAGTSTTATVEAIRTLSRWRRLAATHRDDDFAVLYELHAPRTELSGEPSFDEEVGALFSKRIWGYPWTDDRH